MNKRFKNLLTVTKQFVLGRGFVPTTEKELAKKLGIVPDHLKIFKDILNQLVEEEILEKKRGSFYLKDDNEEVVTGTLRLHQRGFGFLQPEGTEEVFIPPDRTHHAVDGDIVEVAITGSGPKGPEGKVIAILKRARTHMAGTVRDFDGDDAICFVPLVGQKRQVIVPDAKELELGDRVILEVVDWGEKSKEVIAKFSHKLGNLKDPSVDVEAAIEEFELRGEFPTPVRKEAMEMGSTVPKSEINKREDLRSLPTITIDPETAKDFDDALSLKKTKEGFELAVHIADVSHYVKPQSELDIEAFNRSNSTYFPGICVPMLPQELSNELCSLKPNVNRLAVTVHMSFNKSGHLQNYRIARTVIKSQKRFSYGDAKKVLDGKKKSPYKPLLEDMVELCHLLKKVRAGRGSIEFCLPELVVQVDAFGKPTGTRIVEYDITHQLVEEFMLKANEVVAKHLTDIGHGITYRVHEEPDKEGMQEFSKLVDAFGFKLSFEPTAEELRDFFDEVNKTPHASYLSVSFIRKMKLAYYSAENVGHYGLALEHYCHFTSPIRRYADLIVHRALFGDRYEEKSLEGMALRGSERERISARAEGSVTKLKKLRLLGKWATEKQHVEFEAIITGIKPFGLSFEVKDLMLDGYLHVSRLEDDYFVYDEDAVCLRGRNRGSVYRPGDKISVGVLDIDLVHLEAEWYLYS